MFVLPFCKYMKNFKDSNWSLELGHCWLNYFTSQPPSRHPQILPLVSPLPLPQLLPPFPKCFTRYWPLSFQTVFWRSDRMTGHRGQSITVRPLLTKWGTGRQLLPSGGRNTQDAHIFRLFFHCIIMGHLCTRCAPVSQSAFMQTFAWNKSSRHIESFPTGGDVPSQRNKNTDFGSGDDPILGKDCDEDGWGGNCCGLPGYLEVETDLKGFSMLKSSQGKPKDQISPHYYLTSLHKFVHNIGNFWMSKWKLKGLNSFPSLLWWSCVVFFCTQVVLRTDDLGNDAPFFLCLWRVVCAMTFVHAGLCNKNRQYFTTW